MHIRVVETDLPIHEFLKRIREARGGIVQAFDKNAISSELQVKFAYFQAKRSFEEGCNIARKLENEMLLRVAGVRNFESAVKKAGAKSYSEFIVFSETLIPINRLGIKKMRRLKKRSKEDYSRIESMALSVIK